MAYKIKAEERQLVKLIKKMPLAEEDKKKWTETIQDTGLTEEIAEEIRQKLTEAPEGSKNKVLATVELNTIVNHWRLAGQKKNFGR
jgi:menaquinone-dependent protoporphyrinogen IX oxidase